MRFTLALLASLMGGTALADSIAIPPAQHGIFDGGQLPPSAQGLLTSDAASSAGMAKQFDLKAKANIRQAADEALGQRIDGLGQRIDAFARQQRIIRYSVEGIPN
ncbi:hypothetical protein NQF86_02880 [Bombella sp. TMW 2.2543]|uniref:Uncharacterized protein n=1 Tax=Bombella pluederhausensis TaxID=2967336 RepID=A0ABT3WEU6_9PROT|nr:hypothetical protein [Bombella pluederhausensis]MCX5617617.1 hypothetical protein [Bombella pluederhausensis]